MENWIGDIVFFCLFFAVVVVVVVVIVFHFFDWKHLFWVNVAPKFKTVS